MLGSLLAVLAIGSGQKRYKLNDFKLRSTEGRLYHLTSLTAGKPCLIFFLRPTIDGVADPKTGAYLRTWLNGFERPNGVRDINRLASMVKGKMRVAAFSYQSPRILRVLAKAAGIRFLMLGEDGEGSSLGLINQILVGTNWRDLHHLQNVLILPDGTLGAVWPGYSRASLAQMQRIVGDRTGTRLHLDLSKFPRKIQSGQAEMYGLPGP